MRITTVATIAASAERSWEVIVEQFGDAANWASSMTSSRLDTDELEVGTVRIGVVGRRELHERVTLLDRDNQTFAYEFVDPPGPLTSVTNQWTVRELGPDRSEIESEMEMGLPTFLRFLSPLIEFGLKKQLASAIEEFRVYAETGVPHERTLKKQSSSS